MINKIINFCKYKYLNQMKILVDNVLNRSLAILPILTRKYFEKYRNSGNIKNFKIYIILILFFPKTDFFF